MNKNLVLVIFFACISCNTIKIKEIGIDLTQDLIGKVSKLEISNYRYQINEKDTVILKIYSTVFFDKQNNIVKQIDFYPKFASETDFSYKNNLLQNTISKISNRIDKTEYKYDRRNNVIEYKEFQNDTLYLHNTSIYDKRNNLVEKESIFQSKNKSNISREKYTYDYKNKTLNTQSFNGNNKPNNGYLKAIFNKKGYIVKMEMIYPNDSRKSEMKYDKNGNLIKQINFDNSGKLEAIIEYKNRFDEKGNIILTEKYFNEKLIEKTKFKILYR